MKYLQKSFTALGSESNTYTHARAVCGSVGHMEPDVRGKCMRCGEKETPPRRPPGWYDPTIPFMSITMKRSDL